MSALCHCCGGLVGVALGTVLYWYLLYHTTWAYGLAIFSIVFFGFSILGHVVSALLALFTLCTAGTLGLASCFAGGPLACIAITFVGALIAFVVAANFIIAIYGLTLAIHLMNSGASTCPLWGNEATCGWLVVLFFITLLMNTMKSRKIEVSPEQQNLHSPQQNADAPPNYTVVYGNARALAAPFIFDPRSNAVYQAPPAYVP